MDRNGRIVALGLLVCAAACNRGEKETTMSRTTTAAPADTVAVAPQPRPEALSRLKTMAENAKTEIEAARWPGATAMADTLRQSYQEIKIHVSQADSALDRQISQDLDDLDKAIRDKASDAANRLAQSLREAADKIDRTY